MLGDFTGNLGSPTLQRRRIVLLLALRGSEDHHVSVKNILLLIEKAVLVGMGTAMATQIITAVAVVFGILAVVEIALISYAVAPEKTHAVLQRVHDWALVHRRKILIAMCTIAGSSMLLHGITGI